MFILSNGRALFDFWLYFLKGTGAADPTYRRDKVLLYAKNFDKSISCFDNDLDDLDYNEYEKLILCFDFGWPCEVEHKA